MTVHLPDPNAQDCRALSSILARVADKWTVLIVVLLGEGPRRFTLAEPLSEERKMYSGRNLCCSRSEPLPQHSSARQMK
jgi:hypothetical protein